MTHASVFDVRSKTKRVCLCFFFEQVPPSITGAITHYRLGNLQPRAALPLCMGSALGAYVGGQVAVRAPEEPLQILFTVFIGAMGARTLIRLRGK